MHLQSRKIVRILESLLRCFFYGATAPGGPECPHYRGFEITLRHTTVGRARMDGSSARRRDLYLTANNNHNRRDTSMFPVGFEPTIPASERPQTHALDRAATGIGLLKCYTGQCRRKT